MRRNRTRAAILSVLMPTVLAAWTPPPPLHTEVAPGVHLFQTQPYGDVGLDGNSVAIAMDHRIKGGSGVDGPPVQIFGTTVAVDPDKQLQSITLPADGRFEVYAVSLG